MYSPSSCWGFVEDPIHDPWAAPSQPGVALSQPISAASGNDSEDDFDDFDEDDFDDDFDDDFSEEDDFENDLPEELDEGDVKSL